MARHGCSLRAKCKVRVRYSPGVFHNPLGICFLHKDNSNSCQSFHSHGLARAGHTGAGRAVCTYIPISYQGHLAHGAGWIDEKKQAAAALPAGKMTTREIAGMRTQHLVLKVNNWIQRFMVVSCCWFLCCTNQRSHGLNFSSFSGFVSYLSRCQLSV